MKTLASVLAAILTPVTLLALPNYDPFADATASSGTAYAIGNWVSKNDGGTVGTGQKDATGAQWYHAGALANNSPTITAGNVQYPGLAAGSGNKVLVGSGAASDLASGRYFHSTMNKALTTGGSASRFYSFVLQASDISGLGVAGGTAAWIAGFNNTAGASQTGVPTVVGGRTILKAAGAGYQIGLCKAGDAPTFYTGQTFTTSDTIFVVVEYVVNTGTTSDDVVNMWINPSYTTFGNNANKPAATLTASTGTDMTTSGSLQSFLLGNKASTGLSYVDELRVAADWAGVTPALITSQPASLTKDYGQSALFSVSTATSATYQWQKNGSDLSGETGSSLSLPSVSQTDEASYTVAVTGGNGSITSSVATLTVNDPKVTSGPSPASQFATPGATAVIGATAIGTATLTYQWKKDGNDVADGTFGGAVISGATSDTLTITGVRAGGAGDSGTYTLSVTNGNGRGLTSGAATLTVVDPAFTTNPSSQAKNYNDSVTFTAVVAGSAPPFAFVWKKDGSAVTVDGLRIVQTNNGPTNSLTINNLTFADQATGPGYTVQVTDNASQSTESLAATLTVVDPVITTPVADVITNAGSTAILKVQAAGSGTVTYAWKTNGVAVADGATGWGSTIAGATSDTLSIAGVTATDANTYVVEVSGAGPMQSSTGTVSVVQITRQPTPAALVIATNAKAVFIAAASVTGPGSLSYQWRKTSGDIAGQTSTAIAIANAQTSDSDSYTFRVIYGPGSAFIDSSSAALTVSSAALQLQTANLVVARVGDGVQTLRDAGNSIFLDQFTPSGTYVNTVTIPDTGSDSIITRGTAGDTIGALNGMTTLNLSEDGNYLVLNGYRTNYDANATVVLGGTTDTSSRAVTTIDRLGQYLVRIQAAQPDIAGSVYRSAAFDGVDEYWGATSGGTGPYYFGTQVAAGRAGSIVNIRIVSLFNGQLYYCAANNGIYHFSGKPHPGDASDTQDIAVAANGGIPNGPGACQFAVSPDGNTIYLADGRTWASGTPVKTIGGIQKWVKSSGSFGTDPVAILRPDPSSTNGALYLTADFSGANPVIYATTVVVGGQNKVVKAVDDGSNSGAGTATVLATVGPNQQYRGIHFGPAVQRPHIDAINPLPDGNFALTVSGSAGVAYSVQASSDTVPTSWTSLVTNSNPTGTFQYNDLTATNHPQRFYRAAYTP
jgi:hypothetical protein